MRRFTDIAFPLCGSPRPLCSLAPLWYNPPRGVSARDRGGRRRVAAMGRSAGATPGDALVPRPVVAPRAQDPFAPLLGLGLVIAIV